MLIADLCSVQYPLDIPEALRKAKTAMVPQISMATQLVAFVALNPQGP